MNQIDNITDQPHQTLNVTLDDGSVLSLTLDFLVSVQRWVMSFTYGTFTRSGIMLCLHPNIIRIWADRLKFGLGIDADDGVDPFQQNDFSSGRVSLYLLSSDDITTVETDVMGIA